MNTHAATERLLAFMSSDTYIPLRKRSLARALDIPEEDYALFRALLGRLADRQVILELKKGKYGLPTTGDASRRQTLGPRPGSNAISRNPHQGLKLIPRRKEVSAEEWERGNEGAAGAAQSAILNPQSAIPKGARVGRIEVKRGGMGFLLSDPPGNDIYIAPEDLGGALSGDLVAVEQKRRKFQGKRRGPAGWSRPAGRVVQILERAHPRIVGTFYTRRGTGFQPVNMGRMPMPPDAIAGVVIPDTPGVREELEVLTGNAGPARQHDKVAVELIEAAAAHRSGARPTARVVHVFGKAGEAEADIAAILENYDVHQEFPENVLRQADGIPEEIPEEELRGRVCYFEPVTFTIDPEDARDHDDAVALRREPDGRTTLLVHIADVSHYVPEDSPLDLEARARGTSVYLPGQVFPMLPPKLSNTVCSLKEGQVRLTKTARITFGPNLTPLEVRLERSYIRSAAFLTYDQVRQALDEEKPELVRSQRIYEALRGMRQFAAALRQKRLASGSIDLDLPEAKLLLDERMEVTGWVQVQHHWAHQLIEDMMLAANRAVAEYLVDHEIPGLFRTHEDPDPEDLQRFAEFAREFGIIVRPPLDRMKIRSVLERVRGKEYAHTIHLALLTSLKQARYSAECHPHFALNFARYLHFTSPIRRYPDLIVHRALDQRFGTVGTGILPVGSHGLEGRATGSGKRRGGGEKGKEHFARLAFLRPLATHCSVRERLAEDAEEDVKKFRQLQFLRRNPKPCHPGLITGVRDFGLFVELEDCHIEGLAHVEDMEDDYYEYLERQHTLRGRRKRRAFRLGDKVVVRILRIDLGKKEVSLGVVEQDAG